ncbi:MAG TPA: hypothetical protein EYQ31_09145 [Candidatus Handelsmanbacteria bacterium]|nr:hypothetical protein [Candidatus Handelsmanbacteria bacterium]
MTMNRTLHSLGVASLLVIGLSCWPAAGQQETVPAPDATAPAAALYLIAQGDLDELDCILALPPAEAHGQQRFALGDVHGFVHVYEQRGPAYDEVWISDYFESAVAGLFLADINLDGLLEIVAYTENGRIYYLDSADYHTLWTNPPADFQSMTAMTLHNVDEDEQVELIFVADGRLHIYDGRDQFEEWRSDQDNITATEILLGDVDGDGLEEIVLNDGFVFDALYRDLEWQSSQSFGERMRLLDIDDDTIPEIIGEFQGRFLRIFDVDQRRMKAARR